MDDNVDRLIADYDLIIDGTDTFETRYTLNDAAVRAAKPVVHASVFRFEGQLTVFVPFEGPCYRCLYPTPPPPELAPGCSVAGVLGVVPGVMGLLQATEAIKLILKLGDPLVGRLLIWDALDGTFSEVTEGLEEGDILVIGMNSPEPSRATTPGGQPNPFGGGGRRF